MKTSGQSQKNLFEPKIMLLTAFTFAISSERGLLAGGVAEGQHQGPYWLIQGGWMLVLVSGVDLGVAKGRRASNPRVGTDREPSRDFQATPLRFYGGWSWFSPALG